MTGYAIASLDELRERSSQGVVRNGHPLFMWLAHTVRRYAFAYRLSIPSLPRARRGTYRLSATHSAPVRMGYRPRPNPLPLLSTERRLRPAVLKDMSGEEDWVVASRHTDELVRTVRTCPLCTATTRPTYATL